MFKRFESLTRFSHDWTITEKIDGTNACVIVMPLSEIDDPSIREQAIDRIETENGLMNVYAQSRNNLITPAKDNAGFANWVAKNAAELVKVLGTGYHFGEWCGAGIQRRYGLTTKKFALFNTKRWAALANHPEGGLLGGALAVVPVLDEGYMDNPGATALECMLALHMDGSRFAPGFMNPEGVVMRHNPSGTVFKKTFDYDEQGKWAENQARKTEGDMDALLLRARQIAARGVYKDSSLYQGIMSGQLDDTRTIKNILRDLVNAERPYVKLPEELPPETPRNIIDDE